MAKSLFGSKKKNILKEKDLNLGVFPSPGLGIKGDAKPHRKHALLGRVHKEDVLKPLLTADGYANSGKPRRVDSPIQQRTRVFTKPITTNDLDEEEQELEHEKTLDDDDQSESEEDWYDGKTLLNQLNLPMNGKKDTSDSARKLDVVEDLKGAFAKHGADMESQITTTLVATLDHVSQTLAIVEGTAEEDMKRGLMISHEASQAAFELRDKARAHLKNALEENQQNLRVLFDKLKDGYAKREALWQDLSESFERCSDEALGAFSALDANLKRTATTLDKRCRVMNHEAKGNIGREGVLKSLMERF